MQLAPVPAACKQLYKNQAGLLDFVRPTLPKKYNFLTVHGENKNKINEEVMLKSL